ncbi:MAG: 6-phosphogluconolactonase [Candidatus Hydrogenedentes bacterium]|nr:6-phosphogluconolactonase [Candidatus Hydrogenedentota bacterium]
MSHEFRVSHDPAMDLAACLQELLDGLDHAYVAFSGGRTPRALCRLLANEFQAAIRWERLTIFQVDDRCVGLWDERSNWKMLHDELLWKLPTVNVCPIEAERARAAEEYEELLRSDVPCNEAGVPALDLVLLGMGEDGHTASLFPGAPALDEEERLVVRCEIPGLDLPRVTMTYPLLNAARRRWFLVRGADKAPAFAQVREGRLPAARIADATWFIDPEAAGQGVS